MNRLVSADRFFLSPRIRSRLARSVLLLWIGGVLFVTLLALSACGRDREPPADPYARYRPAVKEAHQAVFDEMAGAPRYALDVLINPDTQTMTGTAAIELTNYSQDHWTELIFRLYPTLQQYGGNFVVRSAVADGNPVSYGYDMENTAIRVDLVEPLPPGEGITVAMNWRLEYPVWSDNSAIYALFGQSQGMTSLPLFYPSLAVYEDGEVPGTGRWWGEIGSVRGDAAFNVASLFVVTATMPADLVPVTSGTEISSALTADGLLRRVWVTGPSREFVLHFSSLFSSAAVDVNGTRVTSYWLPEHEAGGRAALRYGAAALRAYSEWFGEYPFTEMRIAPAPISYRGMEYPQVSLLGVEVYDRYYDQLEMLTAHEMAHQWWYQVVHNDPVTMPWLDESLAEYSMRLYMENLRGRDQAEIMVNTRWKIPLELLRNRTGDAPVNLPVDAYADGSQYETVVYGKGALFYEAMRDRIGDRRFETFLQDYLRTYQWQIVGEKEWLDAIDTLDEPSLRNLFSDWAVYSDTTSSLSSEPSVSP